MQIRRLQDAEIARLHKKTAEKMVVYLVDGADWITGKEKISGGLLSIASMYDEALKLPELKSYQVTMATLDSTPLIQKHTEFENDIAVFRLSQIFSYFQKLSHLVINVPELLVPALFTDLKRIPAKRRALVQNLHINIVNQNNQKMPGPEYVQRLKPLCNKVTMTIGHARSCTKETAARYRIPIHYLSTRCSPQYYKRRTFSEKADLLVASKDSHSRKDAILSRLQSELPWLKVQVIQNLTYSQYKSTVERSKWLITFGEGLDWYFLEQVFSGGISFAVFNEEFFPEEYRSLPSVFDSYDRMERDLPSILKSLNTPEAFDRCHTQLFDFLKRHHRYEEYMEKLRTFYRGEYDIVPSKEMTV